MAIGFDGVQLVASGGPQSSVIVTLPSGVQSGDLLLFHAAILAPAEMNAHFFFPPEVGGWQWVVINPSVALVQEFVFWTFYTEEMLTNQVWNLGFVVQITAHMLAYSGVNTVTPFGTVTWNAQLGYERLSANCARSAGFIATKVGNLDLRLYATQRTSLIVPSALTTRAANEYVPNLYAADASISGANVDAYPAALVPDDTWCTATLELIAA
jgi:hypothetical protein